MERSTVEETEGLLGGCVTFSARDLWRVSGDRRQFVELLAAKLEQLRFSLQEKYDNDWEFGGLTGRQDWIEQLRREKAAK